MIPIQLQPLVDHIWQSTLFAVVAGAITLALRNNRAQVRYWLWFSASVKFLVPFSLLAAAGTYFSRYSCHGGSLHGVLCCFSLYRDDNAGIRGTPGKSDPRGLRPGLGRRLYRSRFLLVVAVAARSLSYEDCFAGPVADQSEGDVFPVIHGTWRVWHLRSRFVVT